MHSPSNIKSGLQDIEKIQRGGNYIETYNSKLRMLLKALTNLT